MEYLLNVHLCLPKSIMHFIASRKGRLLFRFSPQSIEKGMLSERKFGNLEGREGFEDLKEMSSPKGMTTTQFNNSVTCSACGLAFWSF